MILGFDVEQLAANVDKTRRERGMTVQDAAVSAGVLRSVVSRLLNPRIREAPKLVTAVKLMHWLGDYDIRDYLLEER